MKAAGLNIIVVCGLLLAGCSSVAYQKPVASFSGAADQLSKSRTTYAATYNQDAPNASAASADAAFGQGAPLIVVSSCAAQGAHALQAATAAVESGQSLDALYASGGVMASVQPCSIGVLPPASSIPPARPAAPTVAYGAAAADAEAAADSAACHSRIQTYAPPPPGPSATLDGSAKAQDADTLWKAIDAYASGLTALADPSNSSALSAATAGTASAIQSAGAGLKDSSFAPAVSLLFLVFDKAVEQARYEALRTAIVCGNPLFIRWRSTLRDTLRLEQIAALERESNLFKVDAARLVASYNPDPDPDRDCHPASAPQSWTMTAGCAAARARSIVGGTTSGAADAFAARLYLQNRADALQPQYVKAQGEAVAAEAIASADPASTVDAFVQAHRALRAAILANNGQFTAVESSADDLAKAADALRTSLAPASVTTRTSKSKG